MPHQSCNVTIYGSGTCPNSRRLIFEVRRRLPNLEYDLVDVSAPRIALPQDLTHVPTVYVRDTGAMHVGSGAFKWLNDALSTDSKIIDYEGSGAMGLGGESLPFSTVDGGPITCQQPFEFV